MKKLIIVTMIAACIALCAAVWLHGNAIEETPVPIPTHAVAVGDLHRRESALYNKKICGRI